MTKIKKFFKWSFEKTGLFWLGTDHTSPKWIKGSKTEFHLYSESGQRQQVLARIPLVISYEELVTWVPGAKSGFCWRLDIQFCRMGVKSPAISFICLFLSRAKQLKQASVWKSRNSTNQGFFLFPTQVDH